MSEQNNPTPDAEKNNKSSSLLASIIQASSTKTNNTISTTTIPPGNIDGTTEGVTNQSITQKAPREPISMAVFAKMIGSLFTVSIIFFGSFLAYIAFNPAEAVFFVNTFNIDPNDIKKLLINLINGTFGFMMVVLSIVWIVTLFRAFWIPKELKRKRLLSWLLASVTGFLLFFVLAFWGYLFRVVNASEYDNPDGNILIYDQAGYNIEEYRNTSRITNTQNIIGPIDIFFDIRSNATLLTKRNLYEVLEYEIDFNGANCNGKSVITGSNPANEQSLICTFDQVKPYKITGTYTVRNREGVVINIPINIPSIEVRGLVNIKEQVNNRDQKIITIDASSLRKFGSPQWIYEATNETVNETSITETVSIAPTRICFKIFEQPGCDRIFILQDNDSRKIEGSIEAIQDKTDSRIFQFSLSGVNVNPNQILEIEWLLDEKNIICNRGDEVCAHTFIDYGRKKIKASLSLASGEKYVFTTEVNVNEPLNLVRHIKIFNNNGLLINTDETYDNSLKAFVLKNTIIPPESLTFDARDVVSANPGYTIDSVLWKIVNTKGTSEVRGTKVDIEFNQPLRYNIEAVILFKKSVPGEKDTIETVRELIIVDIERKNLMPRLEITKTSDYVPSLITVDASQSESTDGEIKKFIFDFGEGRPAAEGDAIQQYQYVSPGDKDIILTIVSETGEKASIKKTIVLKDQIKTIDWKPSMSIGNTGIAVDFEAVGTTGQIEEYIWNFGDNSPVERGFQAAHTYINPGKYTITLTVVYADGTQKSMKKIFEVNSIEN